MSKFLQMKKNTVDSKNQLKTSEYVHIENEKGKGIRILFVGNSITLHGVKEDIGWYGHWGMAASAKEKDYIHRIMNAVDEKTSDTAYCICQIAEWEREYKNGSNICDMYKTARDFDADIIVMRFIENCPQESFDNEVYKIELGSILNYLNPNGKAKIIMTPGFWKHPGDAGTEEYAREKNLPLVHLGDLGERDEMKAIGLFEHPGVANHPGDEGMKVIADRIFFELQKMI